MFQNNQFPGYSESKPSTIFFFCWHTADTSLPEISNKQMNFISIWTQDPGQRDSLSSANIFIKKNRNAFEESFQHSFFWTIEIVFDPQNLFQQPDSKVWTGLELSSGKTTYSQFIWHPQYWSESQSFMKNVKIARFSQTLACLAAPGCDSQRRYCKTSRRQTSQTLGWADPSSSLLLLLLLCWQMTWPAATRSRQATSTVSAERSRGRPGSVFVTVNYIKYLAN